MTFPAGFLFGASVGAHQVEGGNTNSDWWWWEHNEGTPCVEPSGDACDFYHRYAEDIAMLAGFGLDAFRFGIEWSRIEPAEGEFSQRRARPLPAHARGLPRAWRDADRHLPPLHASPMWLHELAASSSRVSPSASSVTATAQRRRSAT